MKSLYLFSTKLRMYWIILPIAVILALAIIVNPYTEGWMKLYPLIIACVGGIAFIFLFFFRLIKINWSEIKDVGRFSPRDSALINEGKFIVLRPERGGRVKVYLYGNDGLPELDWMRDQSSDASVICMFRGRTEGGKRTVKRVLRYFGVPKADFSEIIGNVDFLRQYESVKVSTRVNDTERLEYVIEITETV